MVTEVFLPKMASEQSKSKQDVGRKEALSNRWGNKAQRLSVSFKITHLGCGRTWFPRVPNCMHKISSCLILLEAPGLGRPL